MAPAQLASPDRLEHKLKAGRFVITAEVTPPPSTARDDLLAKARPLKGLADAVNLTDGAGARAHLSALAASAVLIEQGIEPILQVACRDRNRIALQSDLIGAAMLGVRNLLLLRGDDPNAGDQPDAKAVFDLDSRALIRTAAGLRDTGELPNGRKVGGRAEFFLGATDMPVDPAPGWRPDALQAKIDAGAQFIQTQFCMDPAVLRRYLARLREHGLTERVDYLVGIAVPRSAASARWIRERLYGAIIPEALVARMEASADPEAEGRKIAIEVAQEYAGLPGVAGVHVMAPNNEAAVPAVIAGIRARTPKS